MSSTNGNHDPKLIAIEEVRHRLRLFHTVWEWGAKGGLCDAFGGAEWQRALSDYLDAGFPEYIGEWLGSWWVKNNKPPTPNTIA